MNTDGKSARGGKSTTNTRSESGEPNAGSAITGSSVVAALLGAALTIGFYVLVFLAPWQPLQRYFLGHPVAVAATTLFWFAIAVLISKWLGVSAQASQLETIRDEDLVRATGLSRSVSCPRPHVIVCLYGG